MIYNIFNIISKSGWMVAKKKAEDLKKSIPVIVRLSKEEYAILDRRASDLGMNASAFLRLLLRKGKLELGDRD